MVSVLVEDLPPATSDFLHRRARRSGAASVAEHVRHELITLATERAPIDNVVEFARGTPSRRLPPPDVDPDATVLARTYDLPADVWNTLCIRAAASGVPVSEYVHNELVALSRRATIDDVMWEFGEYKDANPDSDVDLDAILEATRYARGSD
jgi:hypothetical protein